MSLRHRELGRLVPTDFRHVERYPLAALPVTERPTSVPSAIGVNWYSSFDDPVKGQDGKWRVSLPATARLRGGHCLCVAPKGVKDSWSWWLFYDQGSEGACVGFGCSRMMSLLNRRRYDGRWLYREAQSIDEWPGIDYDGTSVRAGLDVLRVIGALRVRSGRIFSPQALDGIAANRWATSTQDFLNATGWSDASEIPWLNSWGRGYPQVVYVDVDSVIDRLMNEDGEFPIVTDR